MDSLNAIGVPPEAGRVSAKMCEALVPTGSLVADSASRQTNEPRQRWPHLRLLRYFDAEVERREGFLPFRLTAASKR